MQREQTPGPQKYRPFIQLNLWPGRHLAGQMLQRTQIPGEYKPKKQLFGDRSRRLIPLPGEAETLNLKVQPWDEHDKI